MMTSLSSALCVVSHSRATTLQLCLAALPKFHLQRYTHRDLEAHRSITSLLSHLQIPRHEDNPPPPMAAESTRTLLTNLILTLSTFHPLPPPPQNPTSTLISSTASTPTTTTPLITNTLPPTVKLYMLTLYALLPRDLLPALDLLDRGLVERYIPQNEASTSHTYYVRSIPPTPKRRGGKPTSFVYEVRPGIWHCTCANFTFSIQPATPELEDSASPLDDENDTEDGEGDWSWGSTHVRVGYSSPVPICKHLLAVVLAEQCPRLFGGHVNERTDVSAGEIAERACWWE